MMKAKFGSYAFVTVALLAFSIGCRAMTVVDTFLPGDKPACCGAVAVTWNPIIPIVQRIGLKFNVSERTDITDFLIALNGSGTFRVGVQGSTSTSLGLVPTSAFLFSTSLVDPVKNLSVSGLDWILPNGTYFFVAEAAVSGANSSWSYGAAGSPLAVAMVNGSKWFYGDFSAVAARLNGEVLAVPESSTWSMFLLGLLFVILLLRRRRVDRRNKFVSCDALPRPNP